MPSGAFLTIDSITNSDIDSAELSVYQLSYVDLPGYHVYVPNAFSPNGDGINDRFIAYTKSPEAVIEQFIIYDRWGGEVFSTADIPANDPAVGWDGDGERAASNMTYAYYLRMRFADGYRREIKGGIQLVR